MFVVGFDFGLSGSIVYQYQIQDSFGIAIGLKAAAYIAELQFITIGSDETKVQWAKDFFAYELHPYIAGTIYIPMK